MAVKLKATITLAKVSDGAEGTKTIKADTDARNFTTSQWATYGSPGHSETWVRVTNASDYRIGDIIALPGTVSDKGGIGCILYGTVTATNVSGNSVTATSINCIYGNQGNKGDKGDTGAKGEGLEVVVGTQTAATGSWTGVANFASLIDGQQITYWLPYAGSGNATLNLTLSGGSTTGAIPCYYNGTTRLTTHYGAGNAVRLLYRENVTIGSTTIAKGWWADANYDSNNYDRIRLNNSITAKSAISASRLIVGDDSGFFHLAANTAFDITKPILYAVSAITSGSTGSNNYISYPSVTLRNNASGITLTKNKTCYLVGTLNGNTFTPSSPFFTATIPTSEDGKTYISLGLLISTYQIYLYPEHPMYQFKDGAFKSTAQVAVDAKLAADNAQAGVDEMPDYIASRGENLVTNGTCLLGSNYNFSAMTYDGSDTYYAGGCFKKTGYMVMLTDEFIPVNTSDKYTLSYYFKSSTNVVNHYDMLSSFDIDKNNIMAYHIMWISGSTTTLAQDLKDGDTVVYLTSAAGFNTSTTHTYQKGLIFWNYKNSKGYQYPIETYSRNIWNNLWADGNSIDKTNNTITLKAAWNKGTIPAGTPVSQCSDGSNYSYGNSNFSVPADTWTQKKASWQGVGRNNASKMFREGTAFVKVGWLLNHNGTNPSTNIVKISTVELTKNSGIAEVEDKASKDETEAIKQTVEQQSADITKAYGEAIMSATKTLVTTDEFGSYKETQESELKSKFDGIEGRVTKTEEEIKNANGDLQEKFNQITKWFTFDLNGLTIGSTENSTESPFKVVIDNDDFIMYANGVEVLTLDPKGFSKIPDLRVEKSLDLLGFKIKTDGSGNLNGGK